MYTLTSVVIALGSIVAIIMMVTIQRRLQRSRKQSMSILLTWFDFATDVLFINTLFGEFGGCGALGPLAVLCVVGVGLIGIAFGISLIVVAVQKEREEPGSSLLDLDQIAAFPALHAAILLIAGTNATLLVFLPWKEGHRSQQGFPTLKLLWTTVALTCVEAALQAIFQIVFLAQPNHSIASRSVAVLSLCFSLTTLLWRVTRKLLISLTALAPGGDAEQGAILRLREGSEPHASNAKLGQAAPNVQSLQGTQLSKTDGDSRHSRLIVERNRCSGVTISMAAKI